RRVTEHVRAELSGRGKYKIFPVEGGNDAVLTGEITSITVTPVTFNQQSQASRYAFIMSARVEFKDLKSGKVLWSNPSVQFRDALGGSFVCAHAGRPRVHGPQADCPASPGSGLPDRRRRRSRDVAAVGRDQ